MKVVNTRIVAMCEASGQSIFLLLPMEFSAVLERYTD